MKEHGKESSTPMEMATDLITPKEQKPEPVVISNAPVVHQDERDAIDGQVADTKDTQRSGTASPVSAAKDLLDANLSSVLEDAKPMLQADVPQVDDAVVDSLLMNDLLDTATEAAVEPKPLEAGDTEETVDASNEDVTAEDDLVVSPISTTNDDGVHTFEDVGDEEPEPKLEEEAVKVTSPAVVASTNVVETMEEHVETGTSGSSPSRLEDIVQEETAGSFGGPTSTAAFPSTVTASKSKEVEQTPENLENAFQPVVPKEAPVVEARKIDEDGNVPATSMPKETTTSIAETQVQEQKGTESSTETEAKEIVDVEKITSTHVQNYKDQEEVKNEVPKEEPAVQSSEQAKSDKGVEAPSMAAAQATAPPVAKDALTPKESTSADNTESKEVLPHETKDQHPTPPPKHHADKNHSPKIDNKESKEVLPHEKKEPHQHPAPPPKHDTDKNHSPKMHKHGKEDAPVPKPHTHDAKKHEHGKTDSKPHLHDKDHHQHSKEALEADKVAVPPTPKHVAQEETTAKESDVTPKKKPWWKSMKKEHKKSKKTSAPLGPADEMDDVKEGKMPSKEESPQDEKEEQTTSPTNNTGDVWSTKLRDSVEEPETGFVCGLDMRSKTGEDRQDCACCIQ